MEFVSQTKKKRKKKKKEKESGIQVFLHGFMSPKAQSNIVYLGYLSPTYQTLLTRTNELQKG